MNWHLSTGRLSTIYPFQLQTPLHRVSPLPHLFTPFTSQSQFTFHIVPLLGDRRKPLKWRSVLLRIPNGPSLTPRPLRSTVREFLSSRRHPASSPSSVPKAGGRSDRMLGTKSEIRTPDTPNFRPRVSDIREPVTGRLWLHLRRMGQSPALQRLIVRVIMHLIIFPFWAIIQSCN